MTNDKAGMGLVVVGAAGRMGRTLIKVIDESQGVHLVAAVERSGSEFIGRDAGELAGLSTSGVAVTEDALSAFAAADGVLDFTIPEASMEFADLAAQARIVHVLGTTGMGPGTRERIAAAAAHAPIIQSGNMSLGVNLLTVLVEQAARALAAEDWDIEVVEMHHKHKIDAPSGTALLLGNAAAKGRDIDLQANSVRTRDGITGARQQGSIGFATLRGGSVIGEHHVRLAGEGEIIELSHTALDRTIFARGAIKAALWGRKQKPGLYSMRDVLGLSA